MLTGQGTMTCRHVYRDRATPCPHQPGNLGTGERCLWHKPQVRKGDPYVRDLLLQAATLNGGDLAEFQLAGLDWPGASLAGMDLRDSDLRDARLEAADLTGTRLAGACLRRADLRKALLVGVDARGCDLTGANFAGADLRKCDLRDALLDGTILLSADLREADFTGARIVSFRWNGRTRFAGTIGLPSRSSSGPADDTAPNIVPLDADHDPPQSGGLADPNLDLDRSHIFAQIDESPTKALPAIQVGPNTPVGPAPPQRPTIGRRWLAVAGLAGLVLGAAAMAVVEVGSATQQAPTMDDARLADLQQQHEADVAELRKLQGRISDLANEAAASRQAAAVAKGEVDAARSSAEETRIEASRLLGADDRAAIASARIAELERSLADLAAGVARGDRLGRMLADGSAKLVADNQRLTGIERDRDAARSLAETLASEAARLRQELTQVATDRDRLAKQSEIQATELAAANDAIGRYLAKVAASDLGEQLGEDANRGPLLTITPGKPLILGGDCLVTLRIEPLAPASPALRPRIDLGLTVQRPAAAANPDVTVILYDESQRPLRRVTFGFPHIDSGAPVTTGHSELTCEVSPRFARIVVAPGVGKVTKR
ncbi:hypothetical protein LBMAG53_18000 [Planctomycetota bacterium]|nr:hypothetical protein LBMAG53_18000 [Planctomycetota bacterium]